MVDTKKVTNLNLIKKQKKKNESKVSALSPREIVSELDRYVIGQKQAKKAVAVALRNRWRRQALDSQMREEVLPKNILMIGPTGVGKTEISRRLEALMAIGDKEKSFIISGTGDVLEPEDGIIGIGSGGNYALAAAKVLINTDMSAEEIAKKSLKVASEICVFTNNNVTTEKV